MAGDATASFPAILADLAGQPAGARSPRRGCAARSMPTFPRKKAPASHASPADRGRLMSHEAVTVSPEAGVNDAWRVLAEHGVAQAPVLDAGGRVVGLLLRADMAPLDLLPEPGAIKDAMPWRAGP